MDQPAAARPSGSAKPGRVRADQSRPAQARAGFANPGLTSPEPASQCPLSQGLTKSIPSLSGETKTSQKKTKQAAPVNRSRQALGRFGEDLAAKYLMDLGYQIVQRNWRHRSGEIDLVAMDGQCLVFVEVKTRSTLVYGAPVEAVGPAKLARMRQLAGLYLQTQQPAAESIRLDVIAVTTGGGPRQVEHYLGVGQ